MTRRDVLHAALGADSTAAVDRVEEILAETRRKAPQQVTEPTTPPDWEAFRGALCATLEEWGRR